MQTVSNPFYEKIVFRSPISVASESFCRSLQIIYALDIYLGITHKKMPIRLRGLQGEEITVVVCGPDRRRYITLLEDGLDDFLETNGFMG